MKFSNKEKLINLSRRTLAFPIGRQKLESSASAEIGKDSPYLQLIGDVNDVKTNKQKKLASVGTVLLNQLLTIIHFQGRQQDQGL